MALLGAALRSVARMEIPRMFDLGYSANRAIREVRTILGHAPSRKLFLSDWREITGAKKLERVFRFIPKKYALSYNLMAPAPRGQQHEYRYVFDTTWINLETGEKVVKTQSMGSNRRYSPDTVERKYWDKLDMEMGFCAYEGVMELQDVKLRVVYRKTGK